MAFEAIREKGRGIPLSFRIFLAALLASAIFSALPLRSEPLRKLVLKIAAERTFELRDGWEADFRRMLFGVNAVFERRFGIRFHMGEIDYWAPDGGQKSMGACLNDLMHKIERGKNDIILGFLSQASMSAGIASYYYGNLLLRDLENRNDLRSVFLHELGHVFGAADVNDPSSVMNVDRPGAKFDEFSSQVIQLNAQRTFSGGEFPIPLSLLEQMISLYRRRAAAHPDEVGVLLNLAFLYLEKKDYMKALEVCRGIAISHPERHEVHSLLASIYQNTGEFDQAISSRQLALKLGAETAEKHFNLGLAYMKSGRMDEALAEFRRAVEIHPSDTAARTNLAYVLLVKGEAEQAISESRAALQINGDHPEALCVLAAALLETLKSSGFDSGRETQTVDEAIRDSQKALLLLPNVAEVHNILGAAYCYKGKTSEAEAEFLKALELRPEFVEAHLNIGLLYFQHGRPDQAGFHLKRILEIDSVSGLGFQVIASVFQKLSYRSFSGTGGFQARDVPYLRKK